MTRFSALRQRSWSACFNVLFPDPTFPPKAWERDVAGYLFERGYCVASIQLVLAHAAWYGSVECSPELQFSATDRAAVEAMLPDAPIGTWLRIEYSGIWTI